MRKMINRALRLAGTTLPTKRPADRLYRYLVPRLGLTPGRTVVSLRDGRRFEVFADGPSDQTHSPDFHIYYYGVWEPRTSRVLRRIISAGDVCFDAGANVGWYTILLSHLAGRTGAVHGFEPDPRAFATLSRNLAINEQLTNVVANQVALGRDAGRIVLNGSANALYSSVYDAPSGEGTTFEVELITLDDYSRARGIDRVDFIKIDVEGSELDVLMGGQALLKNPAAPPIIQMESNPRTAARAGYRVDEMIDWLRRDFGYRVYRAARLGRIEPVESLDGLGWCNIFCLVPDLHAARLARVLSQAGRTVR